MSDGRHQHPHPPDVPHRPGEVHTPDAVQYDQDLNVRGVIWTALLLAAGTLLIVLLMWWLFVGLRHLEQATDPPPPALREVRERRLPPEPRLQSDPDGDMLRLRADEDQLLTRPAWIDQGQGTARIPIDLAMEVLARRGLPATPAAPPVSARSGQPVTGQAAPTTTADAPPTPPTGAPR